MSPIEQIFQFVLSLQDEYGFLVDVERLKMCLSSIDDITNLEEVLYRLQSLICCSEEQVSDFRTLFGQRFLGEHIKALVKANKHLAQNTKTLRDQHAEKLKAAESLQKKLERSQAAEEELKREEQTAFDELTALKKKESWVKETLENWFSKGAYGIHSIIWRSDNVRLQRRLSRLSERLEDLDFGDMEIDFFRQSHFSEKIETSQDLICFIFRADDFDRGLMQLEEIEEKLLDEIRYSDPFDRSFHFSYYSKLTKCISEYIALWKTALGPEKLEEYRDLYDSSGTLPKLIAQKQVQRDALENKIREQRMETARIQRDLMQQNSEIELLNNSIKKLESQDVLVKEASLNHRPIFTAENNRAVQTTEEMQEVLNVSLRTMNAQQQAAILSYIRTNARIFRQTLRRKSAVPIRRQIDVRRTIRLAARTDGEPVRIRYKAPKKSHARVVCLVDISGSCRAAAELSLYFMAMMDDAFPGSCKKFAFVNHLVSVDKYFQNQSAAEGIAMVNDSIPSRGVYSDYGRTIHELRTEYESLFHKDTTVIIFGDARNNKRYTAENELKFIADRVRKVFWLNPDTETMWGQGDSVIYQYQRAGAEVFHVSTAGELLGFLSEANMRV